MQIFYLTDRPALLAETWRHVRHFMPWLDRAVVAMPKARLAEWGDLAGVEGFTAIDDESVSGLSTDRLRSMNHVERNVTIRRAVIEGSGLVDDAFLLSDDDYRPIRTVAPDFFTDQGRDVGYYCYDLDAWPGNDTDFDEAQHTTNLALAYWGFPHLSYGSHMPQLIRRDLWGDAFERLADLTDSPMVCEWTLYFNVGIACAGDRFAEPRPFQVMCWPQYQHEWPWWVRPEAYAFENFYPDLYGDGHLFAGLPTDLVGDAPQRVNFEKLMRWSHLGRRTAALDFSDGVANPWVGRSPLRRATFATLKRFRKAYDYLSMDDRDSMVGLAGSITRLESEIRSNRPR